MLSDVPLCCCCLSLQVVSYHACVCGLFHSYVYYTLCLCLPWCCVCVVVCGFTSFFPSSNVFIHGTPYPTDLHLGKQQHLLQSNTANPSTLYATGSAAFTVVFILYLNIIHLHIRFFLYTCTVLRKSFKLTVVSLYLTSKKPEILFL